MPLTGYDRELVKKYLVEQFEAAPRGTAADIATEAGITPSAVARWRRGADCPVPRYWPIIERHLGLPPGSIAKKGGLPQAAVQREAAREELNRLSLQMDLIAERVEALRRQLAKQ